MRATSQLDAIGPAGKSPALPQPLTPLGTKLDLTKVASYNKPYLLRRTIRTVIRRMRTTITAMQADGYFSEMRGKKMLDCHKTMIRQRLRFMETADSVEVAGHAPSEAQSRDNIANQCYIVGGAGFSGWSYSVYLLFRKVEDGKQLMYTFPEPFMGDDQAKFCVIPPAKA